MYDLQQPAHNATALLTWNTTGGLVGSYVALPGARAGAFAGLDAGPFPNQTAAPGLTIEFVARFARDFNLFGNTTLATQAGAGVEIGFNRHAISFRVDAVAGGASAAEPSVLVVPLTGIDRKSPFYYHDGAWHHFVFRRDLATGLQDIWVDGACPWSFATQANRSTALPTAPLTFLPTPLAGRQGTEKKRKEKDEWKDKRPVFKTKCKILFGASVWTK